MIKWYILLLVCLGFLTLSYAQTKSDTTGILNPDFDGYPSISTKSKNDSTNFFKPTLNGYPFAYYTPETQFAFGAGGIVTFYMARERNLNPSKVLLYGFYGTVKSYQLELESEMFFAKNKRALFFKVNFSNIVDRYYGIGNDTPEIDNAEYVITNAGGLLDFQLPPLILIATRTGFIYEYRDYHVVDTKENPYLNSEEPITGKEGGIISGIGVSYIWDKRDNLFFPNKGGYTSVKFIVYTNDLGSDYTFTWLEVNARRYWSFSENHVLATQIFFQNVGGDTPFFKYPTLGGKQVMRGYFMGRYRDKNYLAVQMEWRQYFWHRFGFVAFAGFGDVASHITSFDITRMKPTYGAGLRFLFNKEKKINLRMDIGFGKGTSGIYFGMEEAF